MVTLFISFSPPMSLCFLTENEDTTALFRFLPDVADRLHTFIVIFIEFSAPSESRLFRIKTSTFPEYKIMGGKFFLEQKIKIIVVRFNWPFCSSCSAEDIWLPLCVALPSMVMQTWRCLSGTWPYRTQLQTVVWLTDSDHNFVLYLRINIEASAINISPFKNASPTIATSSTWWGTGYY